MLLRQVMAFGCLLVVFAPIGWAQCKTDPNNPLNLDCMVVGGTVEGGRGDKPGKWHVIKSDAPAGYHLSAVSFRLIGPHPCTADVSYPETGDSKVSSSDLLDEIAKSIRNGGIGVDAIPIETISGTRGVGSWADCEEVVRTTASVVWRYRFQGWTAERRYIDDKGIHFAHITESIKQNATLHTVWVKNK